MNMQQPNMQPQYAPQAPNAGKGLSVTALVLGIVAIVLAWFYMVNIAALICGIVGIVCAVKGNQAARAAGAPTGLGTAGLVLSIIGTVFAGIGFLSCTLCVICAGNAVNEAVNAAMADIDLNALT